VKHHDEPFCDIKQIPYCNGWRLSLCRVSSSHPVWDSSECCDCQRCIVGCFAIAWTPCFTCLVNSDIVFSGWWWFYFWIFSRDAMFMMVAVSWTFSSQSRLKLSLPQQFHFIYHIEKRYGQYKTIILGLENFVVVLFWQCLWWFLSPSFSLFLHSTIFFVLWIHVNCSLDELQVNYNNDRSRWFNRFFYLTWFIF